MAVMGAVKQADCGDGGGGAVTISASKKASKSISSNNLSESVNDNGMRDYFDWGLLRPRRYLFEPRLFGMDSIPGYWRRAGSGRCRYSAIAY